MKEPRKRKKRKNKKLNTDRATQSDIDAQTLRSNNAAAQIIVVDSSDDDDD